MRQTNVKQWCFLAILMVLGWSSPSLAHKVYVFAWAEDGVVYSESSFGDKKVIKGKVEVTDGSGTVVSKGITDEQGNYSFKIPENPQSDLLITMDASMGHMATWRVTLDEMLGAASKTAHGDAMAQKAELEKGPSVVRIASGIGIIFALAFGAGIVNNRRRRSHRD